MQLSSKLSPKDPKEFAKKIREWRGAAPGKGRPTHYNTKGNSTETSRLFAHTQRSVADALRLKFFFSIPHLEEGAGAPPRGAYVASRIEGAIPPTPGSGA